MDFDVSLAGLPVSLLKIKSARNANRAMSADCLAAKLRVALEEGRLPLLPFALRKVAGYGGFRFGILTRSRSLRKDRGNRAEGGVEVGCQTGQINPLASTKPVTVLQYG